MASSSIINGVGGGTTLEDDWLTGLDKDKLDIEDDVDFILSGEFLLDEPEPPHADNNSRQKQIIIPRIKHPLL
jgi:hypothetical protein